MDLRGSWRIQGVNDELRRKRRTKKSRFGISKTIVILREERLKDLERILSLRDPSLRFALFRMTDCLFKHPLQILISNHRRIPEWIEGDF